MTFYIYLGIHCFLCVALVGLVLAQQGRGADLGAAFSGTSNTIFGASGADSLIVKLTTILAILFFVSTIVLVNSFQAHKATAPVAVAAPSGVVAELEQQAAAASNAAAVVAEDAKKDTEKSAPDGVPAPDAAKAVVPAEPIKKAE